MLKQEISIKVLIEIAEAYWQTTEVDQEQMQLKIAAFLALQLTTNRREAQANLKKTMDEISKEAQAKGLTPEILESILNNRQATIATG